MARTGQKTRLRWAADVSMVMIAIAIMFLTLFYTSSGTGGPPWADKAFHGVAFFALVLPGAVVHRWAFLWLVPTATLFGALIEIVQPYFGRSREIEDLYADIAGILGAIAVGTLIRMWRKRL